MSPDAKNIIFYDGHCGLCHRSVRFVLARDPDGASFNFAPLQGELITKKLTDAQRQTLPDSIVVLTADGNVLTRSAAVLYILQTLGGGWRIAAWGGGLIPRALRDRLYDAIASVRYKLFKKPADACPMVPPHLRKRFVH